MGLLKDFYQVHKLEVPLFGAHRGNRLQRRGNTLIAQKEVSKALTDLSRRFDSVLYILVSM
jgi:hypothetical protein